MTTPTEAATAAWYAVKNDTRSPSPTADPTPYIAAIVRAILAAKDAEIAGLREDAISMARWIKRQGNRMGDHACAECHPESEILVTGFRCGYHTAISALAGEGVEGGR